jgi:peptidoglycan/LPS O-acetylase OafA/YrhL
MLLLSVGGLLAIPWKDFVYAATYTINYVMNRPWYLGHLWSLAVEEQFYALWPLTLALLGRRRGFWVASSVLLIVPPLRVAQLYLIPSHQQGITEEFHTIADCIATGCLLAGLAGWSWSHERYRRFLGSSQFWLVPCALVLALILGIHPRVKWLIGIPLFNLAVALSIDRWTRFSDADIVGKFLNWKPLAFIGALSYSLYLWQQPFFDHQSHHFWNAFPFNITAAFLMALTSYYLVERPFLALRYGRARPRPALEASTAPAAGASSPESGPGAVTSGGDVI